MYSTFLSVSRSSSVPASSFLRTSSNSFPLWRKFSGTNWTRSKNLRTNPQLTSPRNVCISSSVHFITSHMSGTVSHLQREKLSNYEFNTTAKTQNITTPESQISFSNMADGCPKHKISVYTKHWGNSLLRSSFPVITGIISGFGSIMLFSVPWF